MKVLARRLSAISILTALILIASFVAAFLPQAISPQPAEAATVSIVFNTPGTTTWTAPAGVTLVKVEVWGGGGKGGTRTTNGGGGGGGGGAYSMKNVSVTPNSSYTVVVGAGAITTSPGGDSYFINTTTILAKGGNSVANNVATGATGGNASSGVGTVRYSGGNGANGVAGSYGGGGGSSAGMAANGNNAINASGAIAPSGGGNGGNGRFSTRGAGSPGSIPGGGGGGGLRTGSGTRAGGAGAVGMVRISYETATAPIVGNVSLWTTGASPAETTSLVPLTEFNVKIPVTDNKSLGDLTSLKAVLYYDFDGNYSSLEAPIVGDAQTCAILTWTKSTNTLTLSAGSPTTWAVNNSSSVFPPLSNISGTYEFRFRPGKVALYTIAPAKWHIYVIATDSVPQTVFGSKQNLTMAFYSEVSVNTPVVNWGTVLPGLGFNDSAPSSQGNISVTYICNGDFNQQIRADNTWIGAPSGSGTLNASGVPGPYEFSLKTAWDGNFSSAILVTDSLQTINSNISTPEGGSTELYNALWLSLGVPFAVANYSGTIYYGIAQ